MTTLIDKQLGFLPLGARLLVAFLFFFLLLSLSGCANYNLFPEHPDDPAYAPAEPAQARLAPNWSGSLYQTDVGIDYLYTDLRAYKRGDLLTVTLLETTQANKSAGTQTNKVTSVAETNPTLFGSTPQFNVPKIIPLASNVNNNLQFNLDSTNTFNGSGTSSQNNSLTGNITVTVQRVLSNGNLVIRGEKWINLNQGSEFIRLTGIVRPYDIDDNNTISSQKIANPRISYKGTGALAEANQTGWLARFFSGPFYPY